jgi:hypothetical protein
MLSTYGVELEKLTRDWWTVEVIRLEVDQRMEMVFSATSSVGTKPFDLVRDPPVPDPSAVGGSRIRLG